MKKYSVLAILLLALMVTMSISAVVPVNASGRSDLDVIWYGSDTAAWAALKAHDIDFIQWSLTKDQLDEAQLNPDIAISSYKEMGMWEFDLNNNYSIVDRPTARCPTNDENVRKALAYITDKDYIVNFIVKGMGTRIDSPVPYPADEKLLAYVDTNKITYDIDGDGVIEPGEDNYPYKYSLDQAAAMLAASGFNDTDGNGYLNYPNDPIWGDVAGLDTTAYPLKICIRSDHTLRFEAGKYLISQLEGDPTMGGDSPLAKAHWPAGFVGGDFDTTDITYQQPRSVLSPMVMRDRNYHVYTGGWSLGRFPTFVFSGFHSMFWYPWGSNYVTDHEHPQLDEYTMAVWLAKTVDDAKAASVLATGYMVDHVCNIPLWSNTGYVAWRKELAGVINMKGYGIENAFTFLNAYRVDPGGKGYPIVRMGCVSGPDKLNILYSQWYFEYALLDRAYTGLIQANPYKLDDDLPWVAADWKEETYIDETGATKTKVTYYLRHDVGCAAPETGEFKGFFNAYDLEFTIWYNYHDDSSWQWGSFMDIRYTKIVDDYTLEVYFDDQSIWFKYAPTYPLLGPANILLPLLCEQKTVTFTAPAPGSEYTFAGYSDSYSCSDGVVKLISATANGVPITECTNFTIRSGYDLYCHGTFVNKNVPEGQTVVLTYWKAKYDPATGSGARGTYLGGNLGLDWKDTMYSYGHHYPISINPAVGGSASLNRNPWFFLTPLLGECDWVWIWDAPAQNYQNWHNTSQTHPIGGYFKIDILDVVKATGSYCHSGTATYDKDYFPGADLDKDDPGHVGILDLVTITGKYAKTFGYPEYFTQTSGTPFTLTFSVGSLKPIDIKTLYVNNAQNLEITVNAAAPFTITITGQKVDPTKLAWVCGTFEQTGTAKVYSFQGYIA